MKEEEEEDYERRQEALDKKEAEAAHETISRCASSIQRVCESFSKVNPSLSRNVRPPMTLAPFVLLLTLVGCACFGEPLSHIHKECSCCACAVALSPSVSFCISRTHARMHAHVAATCRDESLSACMQGIHVVSLSLFLSRTHMLTGRRAFPLD